ncbi:thioredoxin domain-containing protein [Rubrobacter marinus]|uniref:Thioredoxin domain-containing protein n=1 Tax=Rubrobacter marinus TaxID=2653852 RepID=A0A6G8PVX9_9ACTN|nr:thioredoxin domain-containing protein [Rubrobacter marinus]QIN78360.1 thioredoxin domain-containing protein [Rubrobacter marinus]
MTRTNAAGSRRVMIALTVAAAVLVTALLVALSQLEGGAGTGSSEELYSGIPQNGMTLGEADAPVMVSIYEDFQCPYCGQLSREVLPKVVQEYVRTSEVKLESRPMAFLGEDSLEAARAALAASEQDLYWQYHSLLFENQGAQNSGYVTGKFLDELAQQISGLNTIAWKNGLDSDAAGSELEKVRSEAEASGVNSTPTLVVSGPGGEKKLVGAKTFEEISAAIDTAGGS